MVTGLGPSSFESFYQGTGNTTRTGAGSSNANGGGPANAITTGSGSSSSQTTKGPFKEAFNPALNAVKSGTPPGLSGDDQNLLFSRVQGGADAAANQSVDQIAQSLGGSTSNPQFTRLAALARLSSKTLAASRIADIKMDEVHRGQDLENTRRGQMIQLAGIGGQQSSDAAHLQQTGELGTNQFNQGQYEFNKNLAFQQTQSGQQNALGVAGLIAQHPELNQEPTAVDHMSGGDFTSVTSSGQSPLQSLGLTNHSVRTSGLTTPFGSSFGHYY